MLLDRMIGVSEIVELDLFTSYAIVGVNVIIEFFPVFISLCVGDLHSAISKWVLSELRLSTALSLAESGLMLVLYY